MPDRPANLWGGRFSEQPDETFREFNNSFRFDRRLFDADVRASIAHANSLQAAGVLADDEVTAIVHALDSLLKEACNDPSFFEDDAEDVHSFIEARLVRLIGDAGKKLHTGRSRNDQVATAFRLWLRDEIDALDSVTAETLRKLLEAGERHREAIFPGYTHLQRAQPILFAHWCLAYFEMLARDRDRFADVRKRVNVLPLGAGALAGTGFPVDRDAVARELGFSGVSANSLDAVSDRDFAIEFVGACSLLMVHLSRLAEDLILYSSSEFGFVQLSDKVSTGSSLMPQKKNPDALELIRGKAGRVFGHHAGLLATMKGLPLAYNKDMQEDKEAVFDTVDTVRSCLAVTSVVLENLTLDEPRARLAASTSYLNATEVADYLVRKGIPFRDGHEAAGRLVLMAIEKDVELEGLTLEDLQSVSPRFEADVFDALKVESAMESRSVAGGTSPERVQEALRVAARSLDEDQKKT